MTIEDIATAKVAVSEVAASALGRQERTARTRHYAMTRPTFFAVEYAINLWMDDATSVDGRDATRQWETLMQTYLSLGHSVDLLQRAPRLPDMNYAATAGSWSTTPRSSRGSPIPSGPARKLPSPRG